MYKRQAVGAVVPEANASDAGNDIVIIVNPAAGKQLKEGTLQAVYTLGDKVITYTMVKNSAGQYVLHMPAANVVFKAEFEDAPAAQPAAQQQTSGAGSASVQATGALAVAVCINDNEAVIDTTGTIKAGGTLNVDAVSYTHLSLPRRKLFKRNDSIAAFFLEISSDLTSQDQAIFGNIVNNCDPHRRYSPFMPLFVSSYHRTICV